MKLPLKNCQDPDGYIEIGLRGTQAKDKTPKSRDSVLEKSSSAVDKD
jgi:hypothetical protein